MDYQASLNRYCYQLATAGAFALVASIIASPLWL